MRAEILFQEQKKREARLKYLEDCLDGNRLYEFTGMTIAELEQLRKEQLRYRQLYDAVVASLTPKEQWLVKQVYLDEVSLSRLAEDSRSPFYQCAKSTVWRYKERMLRKADAFLQSLDIA